MRRLTRRNLQTLQLVLGFNDKAAVGDRAAGSNVLCIKDLGSASTLLSEKQDNVVLIETAAARTEVFLKGKTALALPRPDAFYFYAAALLDELKTVHNKAFPVSELTLRKSQPAPVPQTEASLLSVSAIPLNAMILLSHDLSDKRGILGALEKSRSRRLVGVMYRRVLPQ